MDNREHTQAANALIEWFNGQEISKTDAILVMSKVIAKVLVGTHGTEREALTPPLDAVCLEITKCLNERMVQVLRGRADGPPMVPPKRRDL